MKKIKFMFVIFIFMIVIGTILTNIYALGTGFDSNIYNNLEGGDIDQNIENAAYRVYGTILTIIQVIAAFGVVFAGYRYMTAGANEKGEMKQTLIYIIIGCILVFGTTSFIKFIVKSGNEITNNMKSEYVYDLENINFMKNNL